MTFDPNDPRLTAFVLGELDPDRTRGRRDHARRICRVPPGRRGDPPDRRLAHEQLHDESERHAQPAGLNHQPIAEARPQPATCRPTVVAEESVQVPCDRRYAPPGPVRF